MRMMFPATRLTWALITCVALFLKQWCVGEEWLAGPAFFSDQGARDDQAGFSVAADGETLAMGSIMATSNGNKTGAVLVFQRDRNTWKRSQTITPPNGNALNLFGWSLAIDADTLVIGAIQDSVKATHAGALYVYHKGEAAWNLEATLTAADGEAFDNLGFSVDVHGDTIVAGARFHHEGRGAAYVYRRDGGGQWSQKAKLEVTNGGVGDSFGNAVSIDGNTIVVGAFEADLDGKQNVGAVYAFSRANADAGNWSLSARLLASDGKAQDRFGYALDISGSRVVVGAQKSNVYLYLSVTGAPATIPADRVGFGASLSLNGDVLAIGTAAPSVTGGVSVYRRKEGNAWELESSFKGSPSVAGDLFGWDVTLTERSIFVGAPRSNGAGAGFLYGLVPVVESATYETPESNETSLRVLAQHSPGVYTATGLPNGLTIDSKTGIISGTPVALLDDPWTLSNGKLLYDNIVVTVTNEFGSASQKIAIIIDGDPPAFDSLSEVDAIEGQALNFVVAASPRVTDYQFNPANLPSGVSATITGPAGVRTLSFSGLPSLTMGRGILEADGRVRFDIEITVINESGQVQETFSIFVTDTRAPVLSACPTPTLTVSCIDDLPAPPVVTAVDNLDGVVAVRFSETQSNPGSSCDNKVHRVWTATDNAGNAASCEQAIVVNDIIAPVIASVGADSMIECPATPVFSVPSASDNCDPNPELTFQDTRVDGECAGEMSVTRTWTAVDTCGNLSTASQTITVKDTTPPIPPAAPANISLQSQEEIPPAIALTATSGCGADITLAPVESNNGGSGRRGDPLVITRRWDFMDPCGNASLPVIQTITVEDTGEPELLGTPSLTAFAVSCLTDLPTAPVVTARDAVEGMLEVVFRETQTHPNTSCDNVVTRVWTAEDSGGNIARFTQIITVNDTTPPPTPTAPAELTLQSKDQIPPPALLTVLDNCGDEINQIPIEQDNGGSGRQNDPLIIVRTWRMMDACGNVSEPATQTITVEDTEAPALFGCPSPETLSVDCIAALPNAPVVTALDVVDGALQVVFNEVQSNPGSSCNNRVTRTWTAVDHAGNMATCAQEILVHDRLPPIPPMAPADVTVQSIDEAPRAINLTATDNCDREISVAPIETNNGGSGRKGDPRILTREWIFVDACGNASAPISQRILIEDTEAPALLGCPELTGLAIECLQELPTAPNVTAVDAVEGSVAVRYTETQSRPGLTVNNIVTRTWTAADSGGNAKSCVQTITVNDLCAPEPPLPPESVFVQSENQAPPAISLTALDNCEGEITVNPVITDNGGTGILGDPRVITRSWIFVDTSGNASLPITQTVTIEDTEKPQLSGCPADNTLNVRCLADLPLLPVVTAIDSEGVVPVTFSEEQSNPGSTCDNVVTRTWTAVDRGGNASACVQVITVHDDSDLILPQAPPPLVLQSIEAAPQAVPLTALDGCGGQITVNPVDTNNGGTGALGEPLIITRTWVFPHPCRETTASISQTITVEDSNAPRLIGCPDQTTLTIQCLADLPPPPEVSALDNVDGEIQVAFTETQSMPGSSCNNVVTRMWTATDAAGNMNTCAQNIMVHDTTPPLTPQAPPGVTVQSIAEIPAAINLSAIDNCGGELFVDPSNPNNGGSGALGDPLIITRTWLFVDACGNSAAPVTQTIRVEDTQAPALSGCPILEQVAVECLSDLPTLPPVTANDAVEGPITVIFKESESNPGASCDNIVTRTWTASDSGGNTTSCTQTITVNDVTPPTPPTVPVDLVFQSLNQVLPAELLTASDNCAANNGNGNIAVSPIEENNGGTGLKGDPLIITRRWTFIDLCGNSSLPITQKITVEDTQAPILSGCPASGPIAVQCLADLPPLPTVTANDTVEGQLSVSFTQSQSNQGSSCNNVVTRMWTASDAGGNSTSCTQIINVNDTTAPSLLNIPQDETVESCASFCPGDPGNVTAFDNCDGDLTSAIVYSRGAFTPNASCPTAGTIRDTWTVIDSCGNAAQASRTITIVDTTFPDLLGVPDSVVIECADPVPGDSTTVTASDCIEGIITCMSGSATSLDLTSSITFGQGSLTAGATSVLDFEAAPLGNVFFLQEDGYDISFGSGSQMTVVADASNILRDANINDATAAEIYIRRSDGGAFYVESIDLNLPSGGGTSPLLSYYSGPSHSQSTLLQQQDLEQRAALNAGFTTIVSAFPQLPVTEIRLTLNSTSPLGYGADNIVLRAADAIVNTWSVTDCAGNTTERSQIISVVDTVPPTFAGIPADTFIECGDPVPGDPGTVTASDLCSGDLTSSIIFTPGTLVPDTCPNTGTIINTWSVMDVSGHETIATQTITVIDTTAPILENVPADETIECSGGFLPVVPVVTASDTCDGDLSGFISVITGPFVQDANCADTGTITYEWSVTDCNGNSTSATQTVTIVDTIAPVIDVSNFSPIPVTCSDPAPDIGSFIAFDDCEGTLPVTVGSPVRSVTGAAVQDAADDALPWVFAGNPVDTPEMLEATATYDSTNLYLEVRFDPATFDPANHFVEVSIDTDQNPATGNPGFFDSACSDAGLIGTEFALSFGGGSNRVFLSEYVGPSCGDFISRSSSASLSMPADCVFFVTVPLADLGGDDGSISYKAASYASLGGGFFTPIVDYLPDSGSSPATSVNDSNCADRYWRYTLKAEDCSGNICSLDLEVPIEPDTTAPVPPSPPNNITIAATSCVDQENDPLTGTSYGCGTPPGADNTLAQSFTARASFLKSVALRLRLGGSFPMSQDVTTEIAIREGSVNGAILGSSNATIPGSTDPSLNGLIVSFEFAPPLLMTPGETYLIEWTSPNEGGAFLTWMGSSNNPFPEGSFYGCGGVESPNDDFNFIVYGLEDSDFDNLCDALVPPSVELIAMDDCQGDISELPIQSTNNGTAASGDPFIITRTWSFTDACGNISLPISQTISIEDPPPSPLHAPLDSDLDGIDDASEAIAGTNPNDPRDWFHIERAVPTSEGLRLTWTGVPAKTYEIEYSKDLSRFSWEVIGFAQGARTTSFIDPDWHARHAQRQGYYRIRVITDDQR